MRTPVTDSQQATLDALVHELGNDGVLAAGDVAHRQSSWIDPAPLQALALLRPRTTAEVAAALAICHAARQPVIVYGGGTNLVRATQSTPGDLLLSLERMAAIVDVDAANRTMTVQARRALAARAGSRGCSRSLLPAGSGGARLGYYRRLHRHERGRRARAALWRHARAGAGAGGGARRRHGA